MLCTRASQGWGTQLRSANSGGDAAYSNRSGTSMAAPNIAGSLGLLTQHARSLYGAPLRASTMKALAIGTADEAGAAPGPDYRFGWGLFNAASAAALMSADSAAPGDGRITQTTLVGGDR